VVWCPDHDEIGTKESLHYKGSRPTARLRVCLATSFQGAKARLLFETWFPEFSVWLGE